MMTRENIQKSPKRPVFLHGMWRCGSTYIWNQFRENSNAYCYYEPLHQGLGRLTTARMERDLLKKMDPSHPAMTQSWFTEYTPLLKRFSMRNLKGRGVRKFTRRLSESQYILSPDDSDPLLEDYVSGLVNYALSQNKTPVLGFNRACLRAGFLKKTFGSFDIYIDRDPRHVWASYQKQRLKTNSTFFVTWLLTAERNAHHPLFKPMADRLPLRSPLDKIRIKYKPYYRRVLDHMSMEQTYAMVFYLWLACTLHGLSTSDLILDMEDCDPDAITTKIKQATCLDVSFAGLKPPQAIPENIIIDWQTIEDEVLTYFPLSSFSGGFDIQRIEQSMPSLSKRKADIIGKIIQQARVLSTASA